MLSILSRNNNISNKVDDSRTWQITSRNYRTDLTKLKDLIQYDFFGVGTIIYISRKSL